MDEVDIAIIGAGVVGLAIAAELSSKHKNIVVLEKQDRFGQETSSRNSEVIHAGMYYPSASLKAKFCVEGRQLLYELCDKKNIAHKKIGKLIVATNNEEANALEKLFCQGKENQVEGLRMVDQAELRRIEPNLKGIAALYSPETGIIDSHQLMQYFFDTAKANGALVVFNAEVTGINKINNGYNLTIYNNAESINLATQVVINSAGLDADSIAELAGLDIEKLNYKLYYCKGQYFRVNAARAKLINHLAYPVPKPSSGGLGVHATLDLGGGMRLGPDDRYLNNRQKDYTVDSTKKSEFYLSARKFLPFLEEGDLEPDTAGIRPKLQPEGGDFRDFLIKEEFDNHLPGFVNLIGIESPGLTCCLSIARKVKGLIEN
ncbi:MAG: NAD(P)/FAD-dependent oxidoreductase [Candidatus Omnitrophota bacterium]